MGKQLVPIGKPPPDGLHPAVYGALVALTAWFVVAVWLLFGSGGYPALDFAVITFFFVMLIGIPTVVFAVWRRHGEDAAAERQPFRHWRTGAMRTLTGEQRATHALVEVLLPIAAVAVGITLFGLIFVLAARGA